MRRLCSFLLLSPAFVCLLTSPSTVDAKPKGEDSQLTPVMVQDFEKAASLPKVWVVNIPNENASVQLATDHPYDGKQCLKLHYHFVGEGNFEYLGIPNKTKIQLARCINCVVTVHRAI